MSASRIIRRLTQGPAGPNSVSTNTSTGLTGLLKGDGSAIALAVDGTDYLSPTTGVLYQASLTDYSGGDATDLDSIATLSVSLGALRLLRTSAGVHLYRLQEWTGGIAPSGVVPTDFAPSTNQKQWQLQEFVSSGLVLVGGTTGAQKGRIVNANLSEDRDYELPNASGKLALTSQTDGSITPADVTGLPNEQPVRVTHPTGAGALVLDVPCHDGLSSTTHPSVVYSSTPWNGYHYWMAHTPFPNASREFPNICASNDGETWEVPEGLTNPIYGNTELTADGGSYTADTELCFIEVGGTTYLYAFWNINFGASTKLCWRRTTDGVTWSARTVIDISAGSVSVHQKEDGTVQLWANGSGGTIQLRTSTDGCTTFSTTTDLTWPASANIDRWHFAIRYYNGQYHLLWQNDDSAAAYNNRLFHLTSTDGINFTGDLSQPVPALVGDFYGLYRSTFVLKSGPRGLVADIWAAQRFYSISTPASDAEGWRIALLRGVELETDKRPVEFRQAFNILRRTLDLPMVSSAWAKTGTGGGSINSVTYPLRLATGTSASELVIAKPSMNAQYGVTPVNIHGSGTIDHRFTAPEAMFGSIAPGPSWDGETVAQIFRGFSLSASTIADPIDWPTYGLKTIGYSLYVFGCSPAGDGYFETDTGIDLDRYDAFHFSLECSGGVLRLYWNDDFHSSYEGGPADELVQYRPVPVAALTNGATAADRSLTIGRLGVTRFPTYP